MCHDDSVANDLQVVPSRYVYCDSASDVNDRRLELLRLCSNVSMLLYNKCKWDLDHALALNVLYWKLIEVLPFLFHEREYGLHNFME